MNGIHTARSYTAMPARGIMSADNGNGQLMDIPTAISLVAMIGAFMRR